MSTRTLVVCSHAHWIAQDFIDANIENFDVIADKGFDLPKNFPQPSVAWWMSTEHAVRLRYSGFVIPFIAPGSSWLSEIPQALTRRNITTLSLSKLVESPYAGKMWIKPAEFKHQSFFAGLYSMDEVLSFNLPMEAILQYTETILSLDEEYRFYVVDGDVITGSIYLSDGINYYDGAIAKRYDKALSYAKEVVTLLAGNQPPAYTLDVAYDTVLNDWLVLEGNPMFSSAIYGSNPQVVAEALLRCGNPQFNDAKWLWKPDPYLTKKYANMRPLR